MVQHLDGRDGAGDVGPPPTLKAADRRWSWYIAVLALLAIVCMVGLGLAADGLVREMNLILRGAQ